MAWLEMSFARSVPPLLIMNTHRDEIEVTPPPLCPAGIPYTLEPYILHPSPYILPRYTLHPAS